MQLNDLPKIQIVHGALLVPHVNIERKEIDRGKRSTAQDLEQGRETIPLLNVRQRRRRHDEWTGGRLIRSLGRWNCFVGDKRKSEKGGREKGE